MNQLSVINPILQLKNTEIKETRNRTFKNDLSKTKVQKFRSRVLNLDVGRFAGVTSANSTILATQLLNLASHFDLYLKHIVSELK